ncbi:hypothetical protein BOTBODRAFT_64483 [Botryobasidium botryosum FD-172 SS1]|uniref:Dipeptidyl-peptidase V n=1 Tax=Botryobasidium botryosum (strain FD-172 SS1) TaxID=930990 RepID=A0A067MQJ4_BOTB1|nr:hypothetical protein BOTBODRAFT_64483 [Botryobasidium botryosum FD-172 SS1]
MWPLNWLSPSQAPAPTQVARPPNPDFELKEGQNTFAPRDLVELPRPGAGVANTAGDLVLISVSKYSLKEKKNDKSIYIASIRSTSAPFELPILSGGEAFWLDSRTIAHVVEGDGTQDIFAISVEYTIESETVTPGSPVLIGKLPSIGITNFRYAAPHTLVFSAAVYADTDINTVKEQDEAWANRGTTALVYDELYARHWDTWRGPKKPSLFSAELTKGEDGKWALGPVYAPLQDTSHSAPVEPFGGTDDFDVSSTHIVYTTKDPSVNEALHTRQLVFTVPLKGGEKPTQLTSGKHGAVHGPVFNKQGDKVAWLQLDKDGYESDRAQVIIYDLEADVRYRLTPQWDRSPATLVFSLDGKTLYFTAGDEAIVKIFSIPIPATPKRKSPNDPEGSLPDPLVVPVALTHSHAAASPQPLPDNRLLFTQSSFTSPNNVFVLSNLPATDKDAGKSDEGIKVDRVTTFASADLAGKDLDAGESFWFTGANKKKVQGWALKPKGWKEDDKKAKWPVVVLIHGGPQSAWEDQWSTRWNPNVFAQQGYFTLTINPTGSTTFGQEFTDAITEDWGGKPFVDLKAGFDHALKTWPEIDPERAVAAGASWGGYAINWIQGHPEFGFNFKALVCHDGVFDAVYNGYVTDELFFFKHDFGGSPWKATATAEKWNPRAFVHKWSTPQLIFHGSRDFRLPETEGIAAFHALQSLGVPSRLVIFPDENHWVLKHENSLKWHYEIFKWFDQFVGKKDEE